MYFITEERYKLPISSISYFRVMLVGYLEKTRSVIGLDLDNSVAVLLCSLYLHSHQALLIYFVQPVSGITVLSGPQVGQTGISRLEYKL